MLHGMFSKRLGVALQTACLVTTLTPVTSAQVPAPAESAKPFAIVDNSFLIEEGFNQEAGVFQNIFSFKRSVDRTWNASFTQEWPLGGMTHQFSYSLALENDGLSRGLGDTLINYRFQVLRESRGRPAFAPRVSLVVPGRDNLAGSDNPGMGVQVNLPASKQLNDVYLHWNAGFTWRTRSGSHTTVPTIGMSGIWRAKPMFHALVEALAEFDDGATVTVSPGFRTGWNVGDKQIVVGFALPIETSANKTQAAAFGYFSYELPFKK